MTGLYVYAIADRPVRLRARGIFGRPLRSVRAGRLHAVVEAAARAPKPTLARLTAQGRVIARLVQAGADILPARFGAHVGSAEELRRALAGRTTDLRRALGRVRGCVQMTVRVAAPPAAVASAADRASGTRFLRARAAAENTRRRDPVVRALGRAARPYARASRIEWREDGATLFHLVRRARVLAYAAAITRAVKRLDAAVVVGGPSAPFAFVEIEQP
jgi:hypothetical protein